MLLVVFSQFSFSNNDFEKGNIAYQNGHYHDAVLSYEKVLTSNKSSAELYFNLGNCYYKLHKVAPAIYNYEKALLLNPDDEEIKNNLKFAQNLQVDDIKEVPQVGFAKMIHSITAIFNYNTWALLSVILSFVLLALFVGYYFSARTIFKRIFFVSLFVVTILFALSIVISFSEKTRFNNDQPAIVFDEVVTVKNEPKSIGSDAFTLHEGTKVFVVESLADWSKIKLSDGNDGWISKKSIKLLK